MALLSFLDEFVQLLADERREVEVVVRNPLVLVLPNGDRLPFHRNARYARYTYNGFGESLACGPSVEVRELCGAVSPLLAPVGRSLRKGA